ncbi:MAG: hypothetical protein OXJ53_06460 [Gammaproteobacteria bacterium]|nr:hypothetical protein [Gammaproteobacteria bacterium]
MADADVLIDYRDTDLGIVALVAEHVARVTVVSQVLDEVREVSHNDALRLGLDVVEPDIDQLVEAGNRGSRMSFNDQLCFLLCRDEGWTCVTNDGALRRLRKQNGVATRYGLRLMVDLVQARALSVERSISIAQQIHANNPLHINKRVLERFIAAVRRLSS